MKLFAFFIASLFMFQAATPVLCGAACEDVKVKKLTVATPESSCEPQSSCCMNEEESSCGMITESKGVKTETELPCTDGKNCCTPCCAVPLCTCFCQESAEIDFTSRPVILTAQFPSGNGTPDEGFCADCFQPPELMS